MASWPVQSHSASSSAGLHLASLVFLTDAVRVTQPRLFPDPQPLVERLGRDFFRQLPETPGVYLMRDRAAVVLYVGKAKNLRRRVCSYRVANPERMARRTLRLLRLVEDIRWEECHDEPAALRRESELLLTLKPRFNRAGVWQGPKRFLVWRCMDERLELAVTEKPGCGWHAFGQMGSKAPWLRLVLVRLIWFATHPELGMAGMPVGWAEGRIGSETAIKLGMDVHVAVHAISMLSSGNADGLFRWVRGQMNDLNHPFAKSAVEADLEFLEDLFHPPRKDGVTI